MAPCLENLGRAENFVVPEQSATADKDSTAKVLKKAKRKEEDTRAVGHTF
jgi:hypothetical protein